MIDNRKLYLRFLDATSQVLNVLFLNGDPNESVSGRMWREQRLFMVKWIDRIFGWQENHCKNAYLSDLERSKQYIKRTNHDK